MHRWYNPNPRSKQKVQNLPQLISKFPGTCFNRFFLFDCNKIRKFHNIESNCVLRVGGPLHHCHKLISKHRESRFLLVYKIIVV